MSPVVFVSAAAHYSIAKAVNPLGDGDDAIHSVPVTARFQMNVEQLGAMMAHLSGRLGQHRPALVLYDAGLLRRDRYVIDACLAAGAAVACVIGGGYARDIPALARRHSLVHRAAVEVWAARGM